MKQLMHIFFATNLFGVILVFTNSCGNPQPIPDQPNPPAKSADPLAIKSGEDILDLSFNPLAKDLGLAEMDVFYNDILINRKKHPPIDIDTIDINSLANLQDSAFHVGGLNPKHFILALKIKLGLDVSYNRVQLLYEPLFMQRDDSVSEHKFGYKVLKHTVYYSYNRATKQFSQVNDTISSVVRYQDSISFKNRYTQTFRRYNNTQNKTGDVESVIFPFQEIDSLVTANHASDMYIFNAAEYVVDKKNIYLKHILLLGADDINKGTSFYTNYGNLSHLCPPSCDKHDYDLK